MTGPDVPAALRATGVGFRYRARGGWALRDCEFTVPGGRITALVGRNGAGKSTLLHLAGGLLRPRTGEIRVLDTAPGTPEARARVALLTQDKPLYPRFTVADTLRMGQKLNSSWDQAAAERTVREGDIALAARVGELSPGQRTRVALALALGKRPELLLLDEPMADLDPVARGEIMAALMTEAAEGGTNIVLSSHVLPELEQTCDWVLLLRDGRVELSEDAEELRENHAVLTGHANQADALAAGHTVVHRRSGGRQMTALVRQRGPLRGDWHVERPSLEDILVGYLHAGDTVRPAGTERTEVAA
ncbi:ABC transporter ATP-binding protein [Streptomyces sp. NBC_01728]|uniref:ABC transporter ATP-binding protein n=1 Tax=unclassified Streptomyces TaxID=2593676 RepID=UPI00225C29D8|nr:MULTISPECIES: ABC transporter ATP-binding protein [unclassified Streptomyces]MCX4454814.1 ABC transporter ATP-binding protein [Streptomyces sp. NBC_01719]MCX4494174.1 ABC transporter ATP-binding protein [Streptomyces sp. NBC_01728]